jgi:2-keto-4-pentenoate hydratase/2-oxohepta-3-ene-1,7-dioic acid hydratase in catechol pathway
MKLATIRLRGGETAAVASARGWVPLAAVNELAGRNWSGDLLALLEHGQYEELHVWYRDGGAARLEEGPAVPREEAVYAPPYRRPRKIWGVGANYREKAEDMAVTPPDGEPICFLKPDTSLIGPDDAILLPAGAGRITAEAEIGIVIGRACKHVPEAEAMRVIAGFTPTLDMTAQDIHARNPRFLGRAKCFDTFFSFGPELATPDECPGLADWTLETVLNGKRVHANTAERMIYSIPFLVAYFSSMMTLLPGDIIMTGTPGSAPLAPNDWAECRIAGFAPLRNPVKPE